MAGSKSWRLYETDAGVQYSVKTDESNARAQVTGVAGALLPSRFGDYPALPNSIKKRYVNTYNQALPTQKRRFFIGTEAVVLSVLTFGATIQGEQYPGDLDTEGNIVTWVITSYRGEKQNFAPGFATPDTGLIDVTPLN